ncbi:MAG: hypothetical protein QM582_06965 [Micropruina sp.]
MSAGVRIAQHRGTPTATLDVRLTEDEVSEPERPDRPHPPTSFA